MENLAASNASVLKLGCCLSAETHARMVFAMEAREDPTTQDRADDVVAVSLLLFEGTIATCNQGALTRVTAYSTVLFVFVISSTPRPT